MNFQQADVGLEPAKSSWYSKRGNHLVNEITEIKANACYRLTFSPSWTPAEQKRSWS